MNKTKFRRLMSLIISRLPGNRLRIIFFNMIFHYKIHPEAKIGRRTVINTSSATIEKARVGKGNTFSGPFDLFINDDVKIGENNVFECGDWILEKRFARKNFFALCVIGKKSLITNDHYIDTSGGFFLGEGTWIAGRTSQFWTHGADANDNEIRIGPDCYLGSRVSFAPGASAGTGCTIGMGSVVTKKFQDRNCLIAGNPAVVLRTNYNWKQRPQSCGTEEQTSTF